MGRAGEVGGWRCESGGVKVEQEGKRGRQDIPIVLCPVIKLAIILVVAYRELR